VMCCRLVHSAPSHKPSLESLLNCRGWGSKTCISQPPCMWPGFHQASSLAPDQEKWSEWLEVAVADQMSLKARWQSIRSFGTSFLWRFRWSVSRVRGGNSVMLWGLCHNDLEVCFGIHLGLWGMTLVIRFSHTFLNYLTPCNISLSTYAN